MTASSGPVDITADQAGRLPAEDAAERFAGYGLAVSANALRVLDFGPEGFLVAPNDATVHGVGSVDTAPGRLVASASVVPGVERYETAAAPYWYTVAGQCFARLYRTGGYMDTCYHMYKEANDRNDTYDWYSLHMFASIFTPGSPFWTIDNGYVRADKIGTTTQYWWDWEARSDPSGSCHSITIGLAHIASLSFSHTACESWTISKGNPTVWLKETYNGDSSLTREVAEGLTVYVAQGGWPQWNLTWNTSIYCRYGFDCNE